MTDHTGLIRRLEVGVPTRIERWPGNDGEDILRDYAGASETMREAAGVLMLKTIGEQQAVIRGQIEAFEFMALQFETYASDNDEIHRRYGTKTKIEVARAEKRSQTWRDAAVDCRSYADKQRKELDA